MGGTNIFESFLLVLFLKRKNMYEIYSLYNDIVCFAFFEKKNMSYEMVGKVFFLRFISFEKDEVGGGKKV